MKKSNHCVVLAGLLSVGSASASTWCEVKDFNVSLAGDRVAIYDSTLNADAYIHR